MKFSDLKNPTAAAAAIKNFLNRFSTKVCLAPAGDCSGAIVPAHTLSVKGMLRPISRDGHVYAVKTNIYNPNPDELVKIELLGIHKTSVFNGFCAAHDKSLFAIIEDQPFTCSPQQLFTYAYRAVAKEAYLKRRRVESWLSLETIKEIHGFPEEVSLQYSEEAILLQLVSLREAEEIEKIKSEMDNHLLEGEWRRIMTTLIPFAKRPTVVCSFVYSPGYDFDGNSLQDIENLESDLSQLMVTIIPVLSGGFALLSYLDTANAAPRRLIESLTSRSDITSSLLWLVFCNAENFAASPDWYESLTSQQSLAINEAFLSNIDITEVNYNLLRDCKLVAESWEPGNPFNV